MQKLLGKQRFEELLKAYIEKPPGKPTLVPESDKRPAINNAKFDFMEEKNHELWCFGNAISEGMQQELDRAKKYGKAIRYFTDDLEEVER